jgi:hypothetical protein
MTERHANHKHINNKREHSPTTTQTDQKKTKQTSKVGITVLAFDAVDRARLKERLACLAKHDA